MNNTLNKKICLSKQPMYTIVGFIISFIVAIISIIICFLLQYKSLSYNAYIWSWIISLLCCISLDLMFIFSILGRKVIMDFEKNRVISKMLFLGFSFKLKKSNIKNVEIIEMKKEKKVLVFIEKKYKSEFLNRLEEYANPFKIEYNEKNVEIVNEFLGNAQNIKKEI